MSVHLSKDEIKKRLAPLHADKALELVVLFGSAAEGRLHKGSDIDIGFLFDRPADLVELTNRVTTTIGKDNVDVVDLRRASPLLRYAAAQKGIALYERVPGSFIRFYSLSYRMYVDTKKLRRAGDRAIERFLQTRGSESNS
jgi:predicted nucleotidyltransferase